MITRTKITLAIVALIITLTGCTHASHYTEPGHVYRLNDEINYTTVCSDTATLEQIETYVSVYHSELGQADGYSWTPELQCLEYDK